jgi:glycosyltransferase involved in cell wall biosynthesis
MMKILLIYEKYYPFDHAFIESVYTQLLPEKGYKIICLARTLENHRNRIEKWNEIEVHLFKIAKKPSFIWKRIQAINILIYAIYLYIKCKFDIVQVRNWEYGGLIGVILKKLFSVKFIFQRSFPHEENYKTKIEVGEISIIGRFNLKTRLYLYPRILKRADVIFAISDELKKRMVQIGVRDEIIHPIGLAFDKCAIPNWEKSRKLREQHNINSSQVLIYFGAMSPERNIEFLIDIFKELLKKWNDLKLILLGGNIEDLQRLKKYAGYNGVKNSILFLEKVNRLDVANYLALSYLSISPIPPISRYMVSSPTKLYESLGLGIPVVGNNLPQQGQVLKDSRGGKCVEYNKLEFVIAIDFLLSNPKKRYEMSENGRRYILKHHTYNILAKKVDEIYKSL